jgi:hypothetical protein
MISCSTGQLSSGAVPPFAPSPVLARLERTRHAETCGATSPSWTVSVAFSGAGPAPRSNSLVAMPKPCHPGSLSSFRRAGRYRQIRFWTGRSSSRTIAAAQTSVRFKPASVFKPGCGGEPVPNIPSETFRLVEGEDRSSLHAQAPAQVKETARNARHA